MYIITRNRGKITLELSDRDSDIIFKINHELPEISKITERIRNTNFKENYKTITLSIYDLNFRKNMKKYIPVGKKSSIVYKPDNVIEKDYWRGIIDGDGSLGFTKNNIPYISLVTKSKLLATSYISYIKDIVGIDKITTVNKRDNVYNIMLTNENAQMLIKELYYDNCFSINRKIKNSIEILLWKRPDNIKKVTWSRKKWSKDEDDFILSFSLEESVKVLNRTEKAIKIKETTKVKNKPLVTLNPKTENNSCALSEISSIMFA
jgi:hypothetical protein